MKLSGLRVSITSLATASFTLLVQYAGLFQTLEWTVYDRFFSLRPHQPTDDRILIVTIDETDILNAGRWPLSDADLTHLVQTLQDYQPAAIGLDLYRDLPIEPGHDQWAKLLSSTSNLIGIEKGIGLPVSPPKLLQKTDQVALTDVLVDSDGKVRRALLSHPLAHGKLRLGLGTKLALMYLEKQGIVLEQIDDQKKRYRLGKSIFVPFDGNDGSYVGTNAGGYQILLNYRGNLAAFRTTSLTQVLKNSVNPEWVRDRIVLIGSVAPSLNDFFYTPLSSHLGKTPQPIPGILIHANIASQLLGAALEGRKPIQTVSEPLEWLWIILWSVVGAIVPPRLLTIHPHHQKFVVRGLILAILGCLGSSIIFVSCYGLFLVQIWIPFISPLVASLGSVTVITISHLWQLQKDREALREKQLRLERDRIRAEAASQAKSLFLANMSHELRTPLNAILGFTQIMIRDPDVQPTHRDYLKIVYHSSEHLLELIDDILDLSKLEVGRMSLNNSEFDLYYLIESSVALFQSQAQQKNLELVFYIEPEVPQYIRGDRKKLRSCLVNPLSNAIKFTQEGSISLHVSWVPERSLLRTENLTNQKPKKQGQNSILLSFEITDTGVGIEAEELDQIFEAFVQTKIGQQSGKGTGLGLAITRQFVQLMGGVIVAESWVGEGTIVKFEIEVVPINLALETIANNPSISIALAPGQPSFRILVVDPDANSRLLLVTILDKVGFEVRSVENGLEAIIVWDNWQPHLIWMNVQMPILDGLIATRQIREREGQRQTGNQSTVIIGISARAGNGDEDAMLASGCDHVVHKPLSETIVLETLAQYLGVCYRYESLPASASASFSLAEVESLLIDQLSTMPFSWVQSLNQAANEVNETLIFQLIDRIPDDQTQLAEYLLALANDFRLDVIVRLTQSVLQDS